MQIDALAYGRSSWDFLLAEIDGTGFNTLREIAGRVQLARGGRVTTVAEICTQIEAGMSRYSIYEVWEADRFVAIQDQVTRIQDPVVARALLTYAGFGPQVPVDVDALFAEAARARQEAHAALYGDCWPPPR